MCATSATSTAPASRAISANAAKSMVRGSAVPPQKISLGRSLRASSRTSSKSIRPVSARTPYCTPRNHLPVAETPQPCVRWPPIGSAMPITVSPGSANARYTARLAGEPEYGWTLACSTPNRALARSTASVSTLSMFCWPS